MPDARTHDDFPHEHEFTADVVSWMAQILDKDSSLPFASAKFDRRSVGSQKRRDLSLTGRDGKILVTGEIKLPYQKDGATPYNASVVSDARRKATRAGADYFFTWNVNECVLWKTETPADDPAAGQYYQSWKVTSVAKEEHLALPSTEDEIKSWLGRFLNELGRIVRGSAQVGFKSPDERFVESLESALSLPIRLAFEELEKRYKTTRGQSDLDAWMRDEQGWTLAADPIGIRDILERAAKFACYALVNRLVIDDLRASIILTVFVAFAGTDESFENDGDEDEKGSSSPDRYYGGKWGIYLRAPDLWFELMDRFGGRFAPVGEIAEVRFGVKSGKDEFFFPRDVSRECLERFAAFHEFRHEFGVPREDVESGRVKLVRCGEKYEQIKPIEAEYLEPEVHSLMEVSGYTVGPQDCARMILLVGKLKSKLKGTCVLRYIEWGESRGYHKGSTCASRVTATRGWYDLTGHRRGNLFWPMAQQYKHSIPHNESNLIANHNLFDVITHEKSPEVIGGILNSSFVVLSKFLYGRPVGNEGNLKTEVIDVTMMPVPNPSGVRNSILEKISVAFQALKQRPAMQFLSGRRLRRMAFTRAAKEEELAQISDQSELEMSDRRTLDDAVLEMLGVRNQAERRQLLDRLYSHLGDFFEGVRQKEEIAIGNKNRSKRKVSLSPVEIAHEFLADIKDKQGHLLRSFRDFIDVNQPYVTFDLPSAGVAEVHEDIFAPQGSVKFAKGRKQIALLPMRSREQAALVAIVASTGVRGLVRVPLDADACVNVQRGYRLFVEDREQKLRAMIAERTGDADLQDEIFTELIDLILLEAA